MENKEEVEALFTAYFNGQKAIYDYFGVKEFDTYNYELQQESANWYVDRPGSPDFRLASTLHWAIPLDITDPDFLPAEGTYQGPIHGIFRKDYHTLIFIPSSTGDAGFALIFDNDQELMELPSS